VSGIGRPLRRLGSSLRGKADMAEEGLDIDVSTLRIERSENGFPSDASSFGRCGAGAG
jgi:hypothetical protein